jgi:hypothetical protein
LAGKDASGKPVPEDQLARIKATHEKIQLLLKMAKWLYKERAVAALDHWLNGCGKFAEISAEKATEVRGASQHRHAEMLKSKLTAGLPDKLAFELAKRTPAPDLIEFDMDWKGGASAESKWIIYKDDDLAYNGSTIHSRAHYQCTRDKSVTDRLVYECQPSTWISWVEDNYDFEDGKTTNFLPDDADMNLLARYGCGANYQRASASWTSDASSLKQVVSIDTSEAFQRLVKRRQSKIDKEAANEASERLGGALKSAEPAEFYKADICP